MAWRDEYQPGSIDGVPFLTTSSEFEFGRRTQVHEYPLRDIPVAEDNGRKARQFTLECVVIGADYMAARDALIAVLEAGGPHELIHPYFGAMQIHVLEGCRCRESTQRGGSARITVPVVEAGSKAFPIRRADTRATTQQAITDADREAARAFAAAFTVDGQPAFVERSAVAQLTGVVDTLRRINGRFSALQTPFNQVATALDDIQSELTTLIHQPLALAERVQAVLVTLFTTPNAIDMALGAYKTVADTFAPLALINDTPARQQEKANNDALGAVVTTSTLMATAATITEAAKTANATAQQSPFDSYNHAITVRDEVLAGIAAAAESADATLYAALATVAEQFARHIDAHGVRLARIRTVTPAAVVPALVLAHQLYGDASRAGDIVRRNATIITHPGFVPQQPLEVLDA